MGNLYEIVERAYNIEIALRAKRALEQLLFSGCRGETWDGLMQCIEKNVISLINQRKIEGFEEFCSKAADIIKRNVYSLDEYRPGLDHHWGTGINEGEVVSVEHYDRSIEVVAQYLKDEGIGREKE